MLESLITHDGGVMIFYLHSLFFCLQEFLFGVGVVSCFEIWSLFWEHWIGCHSIMGYHSHTYTHLEATKPSQSTYWHVFLGSERKPTGTCPHRQTSHSYIIIYRMRDDVKGLNILSHYYIY